MGLQPNPDARRHEWWGVLDLIPAILLACHLLAGLMMWRMWRGRSAGGVARCRRCWYDLSGGLPGVCEPFVCPECGRVDVTRSGLLRRQRRLGPLAILMALQWLVGYAWFLGENGRRGWLGLVPTTALVWMVEDIESGTPLAEALATRWRADVLWPWHQKVYAGRMMDRWLEKGTDRTAGFVSYRRRAVVGEPLPIMLDAVWWDGPAIAPWVIAMTPEQASGIPGVERELFRGLSGYHRERLEEFAPLRPGETRRDVRIALVAVIEGGWGFVRRDITVRVEVEPVPAEEGVLRRVSDPALIASMRGRVGIVHVVRQRGDGATVHFLRLVPPRQMPAPLAPPGCSLAMAYTIEHECRVIESGRFGQEWVVESRRLAFLDGPRWAEFYDVATGTLRTEGLVLRIRPDMAHALADFRFDSVWDGEIEIRLDEVEIERVGAVGRGG